MTTTKFMNENGQQAILSTNDTTYRYYSFDDETSFRIDDEHQVEFNAYWENGILMDDLNRDDIEIEFIADGILDYLLHEDDLKESLTDEAIDGLVNYQMSAILKDLDRYTWGWLRWQH